jgi:hypothetical protein
MSDTKKAIGLYVSCIMIFGIICFTILIIMLNNKNRFLILQLQDGHNTPVDELIKDKSEGLWGAIALNILTLSGIAYYFKNQDGQ